MTVTLFVHSPIGIDDALKAAIDALGPVTHIVAPNIFHHVYAGPARDLYPSAKLHLAPGLDKKRPDLRGDSVLSGVQDPGWRGEIEAIPIKGTMLHETAFVHHPSGTLICSDLIENFEGADDWFTRVYLKVNGVHGRPGLSRALRLAFRDKRAGRRSIDAILERPFDTIALAHALPSSEPATPLSAPPTPGSKGPAPFKRANKFQTYTHHTTKTRAGGLHCGPKPTQAGAQPGSAGPQPGSAGPNPGQANPGQACPGRLTRVGSTRVGSTRVGSTRVGSTPVRPLWVRRSGQAPNPGWAG